MAPTISPIPDQITLEDEPILRVPFTIQDADTPLDQLQFLTVFTPFTASISPSTIVIGGAGSDRWFSIYPPPDKFGEAQASITVRDETGLSSTARFNVQVIAVNDPPQLSFIPDQTAVLGQTLVSVPFSVSDLESSPTQLRLKASSSRQSVVRNDGFRFGPGNRYLFIALPATGRAGSTAITIQADEGQSSNSVSFILNVQPPEFARSSDPLAAGGENFEPLWGDFNGDGLLDLLVSPSQIYINRGNGSFGAGIELPQGIVASGATAADFDGDGNLDLLFYSDTAFPRLFRNSGGSAPTFSEVAVNWPAFRSPYFGRLLWADMDGDGALDIVGGIYQLRWLQNHGAGAFTEVGTGVPGFQEFRVELIAIGDADNDGDPDILARVGLSTINPALRLYLNDGTGHLVDSQVTLPQGYTRAGGWTDVDGDGWLDLWLLQSPAASTSSNSLVVLRQEGGRFLETFRLTAPFANQTLFVPVWADFDNDGNIDFVGSYWPPASPFTVRTNFPSLYRNDGSGRFTTRGLPVAANFGLPAIAAADFDDDGSPDLITRIGTGLAPWRNQAPAINALPDAPTGLHAVVRDNLVMLLWTEAADANQTAALSYNLRVGTAPGKNDVVASMSTTNGARMVPAPGNAGFKNWLTLNLPLERLAVETLYWTVQAVDNGFQGGPFASEHSFFINPPGNQPPVITGISDITMPEDTTTTLTLYFKDDRTAPDALRVQATSSNPTLFPAENLTLNRFKPVNQQLRVDLNLKPLTDSSGQAVITVTATDRAGLSASRFFFVTVTPVNDPPVLVAAATLLGFAGTATPPLSVSALDKESSVEQLTLTAQSLAPQIVPDGNISITRTGIGWDVVAVPLTTEPGQADVRLTVRDPDGGESERNVTILFQQQLFTAFATMPAAAALLWADVNADRTPELLVGDAGAWGLTVHSVGPGNLPMVARLTPPQTQGRPLDVADFDNDGDVDLLAAISPPNSTNRLVVYRNLGNFAFQQVPGALFYPGTARFADFDRDGRPDVWVVENPTNLLVYRNNGLGFEAPRRFELIAPPPPELEAATGLEVIDLDGDGIAELILGRYGYLSGNRRQTVYRRAGDTFQAITNTWAQYPIYDVADLDQDQLPDLVSMFPGGGSIQVWRNNGALNFSQTLLRFSRGVGAATTADFDGDGISDVLPHQSEFNQLFLGAAGLVFNPIEVPFARASVFFVAPADFDRDGVLDIAVSMSSNEPSVPAWSQTAVYRGHSLRTNHPPSSPANLRATVLASDSVVLSWDRAADPEQAGGLTYNVRVGTSPGLGDVLSPMSLPDGCRLVPRRGNAWWNTKLFLTALQPERAYYWSVQAVDNSFVGGPFAAEASFTLPEAFLALHPASTDELELELHAPPTGAWKIEVSNDLQSWREQMPMDVVVADGTNGNLRLKIDSSSQCRFFRAHRID